MDDDERTPAHPTACVPIGFIEEAGAIVLRELAICLDDRVFSITVAVPWFYAQHKGEFDYDNVLLWEDLSDEETVVRRVLGMTGAEITPYLQEELDWPADEAVAEEDEICGDEVPFFSL